MTIEISVFATTEVTYYITLEVLVCGDDGDLKTRILVLAALGMCFRKCGVAGLLLCARAAGKL